MPGDSAINLRMKEPSYPKSPRDSSQAEVMAKHPPLTETTKNWEMEPKTPTPRAASQAQSMERKRHFLSAVSFTLAGACLFAGFLSEALGFILGFAGILVALKLTLME